MNYKQELEVLRKQREAIRDELKHKEALKEERKQYNKEKAMLEKELKALEDEKENNARHKLNKVKEKLTSDETKEGVKKVGKLFGKGLDWLEGKHLKKKKKK